MKVTFLGCDSNVGQCPTAFKTDRGTYLVQGKKVDDPDAVREVSGRGNGVPLDETVVEIPRELIRYFIDDYRKENAG